MQAFEQLELDWAKWNDLDPAGMVACSSGTAALHLALEAFRLPPGSEVLVPDFTMIACARAVTLAGLTPVFVDCDERLLMDVGQIGLEFGSWERVGAVMLVHVYGRKCNDDLWDHWAVHNGVLVIEDLAEAHGLRVHPRTSAACWSFFANKHVHGEEGGAVWFRDPSHAVLARQLRCVGFASAHDYRHVPRGMNYRLANSLARLILDSLSKFDEESRSRRSAEAALNMACPDEWKMPARDATWVYDFRVPGMTKACQDNAVAALNSIGIKARHGFYPLSLQQEYLMCRCIGGENAVRASREIIYVPLADSSLPAFEVVQSVVSFYAMSGG